MLAGTFTGTGTVNIEGDLSPGNSPARVEFAGDVVLGPHATLNIELGGIEAGIRYDQINVAGEITLGGTLEISFIDDFIPSAGESFDILNFGSLTGSFSSIVLPPLDGLVWDTSQFGTGMLRAITSLSGDFNFDGTVDAADYVVWRTRVGTQVGYETWRANFGRTASSSAGGSTIGSVPEPTTLIMFVVALTGFSIANARQYHKLVHY